jgi:hypothetical protein
MIDIPLVILGFFAGQQGDYEHAAILMTFAWLVRWGMYHMENS